MKINKPLDIFVKCENYPDTLLGEYSSYQNMKEAIIGYLIGKARFGEKTTYLRIFADLNIPMKIDSESHHDYMFNILSEIDGEQCAKKLPLLSCLVGSKTNAYLGGSVFMRLMDIPEFNEGHLFDKNDKISQAMFWGVHIAKCWRYYAGKQKKYEEKETIYAKLDKKKK